MIKKSRNNRPICKGDVYDANYSVMGVNGSPTHQKVIEDKFQDIRKKEPQRNRQWPRSFFSKAEREAKRKHQLELLNHQQKMNDFLKKRDEEKSK